MYAIRSYYEITFENLLSPAPQTNVNNAAPGIGLPPGQTEQPYTRTASIHFNGMQLVDNIASDGSNVGANGSSLVAPGSSTTYKLYAEKEGAYGFYSMGAPLLGEGNRNNFV